MNKTLPILLALLILAACSQWRDSPEAEGEEIQYFDGEGVYLFHTVSDSSAAVTIDHKEIPGFMDAMAMSFLVHDRSLLEGLQPGQMIRFRVRVESDVSFYIDRIETVESFDQ